MRTPYRSPGGEPIRVLLLEDDPDDAALASDTLRGAGDAEYVITSVDSEPDFRRALAQPWDVVLADYSLPSFGAPAALRMLAEYGLDTPLVVISGHIGDVAAAEVIRRGAADFVAKDRTGDLSPRLVRAVHEARSRRRRARAERQVADQAMQLSKLNQELAHANEELTQFALTASHDLAAPLRTVRGMLTLLVRRLEAQLDEESAKLIGFAVDSCEDMQALIDGLLSYCLVGNDDSPLERIDSGQVVKRVLGQLHLVIEQKEATITVSNLPLVRGRPSELAQIFSNLLGNALKFSRPGVTPEIEVCAEPERDTWRFSVTDNGIGISEEQADRIFEMFARLNEPDRYAGAGIGLASVKKLVERYGGRVGAEHAPGGGTRIWFTLPGAA